MNIEAMKQAIEALTAAATFTSTRSWVLTSECREAIEALRVAIQQAQQPATPEPTVPQEHEAYSRYLDAATTEPVLTVETEPDYWSGGHFCEGTKPHINPMKVWSLPIGTKLYTHPAPSGLDDSKRLDYLQDRGATIDLIPGVTNFYPMRFRVGGLDSSANIDVRAAIDVARKATK